MISSRSNPRATVSNHLALPKAGTSFLATSFQRNGPTTRLTTKTMTSETTTATIRFLLTATSALDLLLLRATAFGLHYLHF